MTPIKDELKKLFDFTPKEESLILLDRWKILFEEYNSHTNLMSKNDIRYLYQKHVIDSLSIVLFEKFKFAKSLLDIGCGGGFPSLIISLFFKDINVIAVDSVAKKTEFLKIAKKELGLDNLEIINSRAENYPSLNVDIITNRAVGKIKDVWKYSKHHLKPDGFFVSYKALTANEEAKEAQIFDNELKEPLFIPYKLPLAENYTRELVIFKFSPYQKQ